MSQCSRCQGSGTIALWARNLLYAGPGPVPEDARGVCEAWCDGCAYGRDRKAAEDQRRREWRQRFAREGMNK